jgi:acetylornithine deacetylase/succinyl-diaminopimelate desuccinylase-like protein
MSTAADVSLQFLSENRNRFLGELKTFLTIPSISTDPERAMDVKRAAEWLGSHLSSIGMQSVEIFPTAKHPILYAENLMAGKEAPTLLIYGHYDIQPVDPLDLWKSEPFIPANRDDCLFARGASDMKGQIMAVLNALEAYRKAGPYKVNLKFLFEGEEEIGSPNLLDFILKHKEMLSCDYCLNPDAGMIARDVPTITYGLRGLCYFEIHLRGPAGDLHSGLYGGTVHNPAQALTELVAGMHDTNGSVTIPGFYDRVRNLDDEERKNFSLLPMTESYYLEQTGVPLLWGESDFTPVERVTARPTLEVNGLLAGFTGEGAKTVLPAKAMAKISTRLVPDQDPKEITALLSEYLEKNIPPTMKWELVTIAESPPSLTERDSDAIKAAAAAMKQVWGKDPLYKREGGSIPVTTYVQEHLGAGSVLTGFGLPEDNIHAPNERLHLPSWFKGMNFLVHFFNNLSGENSGST